MIAVCNTPIMLCDCCMHAPQTITNSYFFCDCCMQNTYNALRLLYAMHHKPSPTHIFSVIAVCKTPILLCDCCMQYTTNQLMSSLSCTVTHYNIILHLPPHIYVTILQNTSTIFCSPFVLRWHAPLYFEGQQTWNPS